MLYVIFHYLYILLMILISNNLKFIQKIVSRNLSQRRENLPQRINPKVSWKNLRYTFHLATISGAIISRRTTISRYFDNEKLNKNKVK